VSASAERPAFTVAFVEFIATAFLLIAVVGSGIAAENLSGGNVALALLANAMATAAALFVLILVFAPLSGAHMNPAVTLAAAAVGDLPWKSVPIYVVAQCTGGIAGTLIAHIMYQAPLVAWSTHARTGVSQWVSEGVALLGLLGTIWGSQRYSTVVTAAAVAMYIGGAYWFTSSTSFANPAVTLARSMTNTFSGIQPGDVPGFVVAQLVAVIIALPALRAFRAARTA